jgi:hypothetical protein
VVAPVGTGGWGSKVAEDTSSQAQAQGGAPRVGSTAKTPWARENSQGEHGDDDGYSSYRGSYAEDKVHRSGPTSWGGRQRSGSGV